MGVGKKLDDRLDLVRAAEERGSGNGEADAVERLERWVLLGTELVDALGCVEVLEVVIAEILQLDVAVEELGGLRESTTWPPWAALMMRAARWTSIPMYFGGSRGGGCRYGCRRGSGSGRRRVRASPRTLR